MTILLHLLDSYQIFQTAGNPHSLRKALGVLEPHHIGQGNLRTRMCQLFRLGTLQPGTCHFAGARRCLGLLGAHVQKSKGCLLFLFHWQDSYRGRIFALALQRFRRPRYLLGFFCGDGFRLEYLVGCRQRRFGGVDEKFFELSTNH